MKISDNIIIGAGLSGLSCAWALRDSLILEKGTRVGGLAQTIEFKGFRFDLGGHRFFTDNSSIDKFVRAILSDKIIEVKRKSKIYREGKFIDYPLRLKSIFQFNPAAIGPALFFYLYRKFNPLKEFSFKERTINRFGDYLYKEFFKEYSCKAWGIIPEKLSKDLVDARLRNVSLVKLAKHIFTHNENIRSFRDKFIYPKEGIGEIAQALAKRLDVHLQSKVTDIIYSKDKVRKVIVNNSQEFSCSRLVSTMPITELVNFFDPPLKVKKAAENLHYRSLICIFFILEKKSFTENHWIYFPGREIFGRLHEPKNWYVSMVPEEQTGICVEIFCNKDDFLWEKPNNELISEAIKDLPNIKMSEIKDYCLIKIEHAYPIYTLNYQDNLKIIKDYLSGYKNLFFIGRTGSFSYINIDECLAEGLKLGQFLKASFSKQNA